MKKIIKKIIKKFFFEEEVIRYKKGKRFYSNSLVDTLVPEFVEIGDDFTSAPGSIILAHDASTFMHVEKYRIETTKIGNKVFLGANSVVMPGITIGNNVIVGAGAIVTKNIADNSVVVGNPARFMCTVEEYCEKCKNRGVLFGVPENMLASYKEGKKMEESILEDFRKSLKHKS